MEEGAEADVGLGGGGHFNHPSQYLPPNGQIVAVKMEELQEPITQLFPVAVMVQVESRLLHLSILDHTGQGS